MLAHYYYCTNAYGIWYIACESALCELKFMGYDRLAVPQGLPASSLPTCQSLAASRHTVRTNSPEEALALSQGSPASHLAVPQLTLDEIIHSQAPLKKQPPLIQTVVAQLDQYFEGRRQRFTIPLAPQSTDFQKSVWQEACQIPYGSTASYKELSDKLQSSPRAVGQALKKNPILIVIPCHRVIQASKAPGGYSAGVDLKHKLLLHEMNAFTKEKN